MDIVLGNGRCKFGGGKFNLWTRFDETEKVQLKEIDVQLILDLDPTFEYSSYLEAHFDPNIWDVSRFGLLYTDDIFEKQIIKLLNKKGIKTTANDVFYSEQGMQGRSYVHFDVRDSWIQQTRVMQLLYGLAETFSFA